jgi:hypothetical protein
MPSISSVLRASALLAIVVAGLAGTATAQQSTPTDTGLARAIRQPVTATRGSTRRMQVFSEAFSVSARGPHFLDLDSGVTYRVFIDKYDTTSANLSIAPRNSSIAPIRFSTSMFLGNSGVPFVAMATTGYRVDTAYNGRDAILVRIYREAADVYSTSCVADPAQAGCRMATDVSTRPSHGLSPAVMIMIGFLPLLFMGMMRNGKSF